MANRKFWGMRVCTRCNDGIIVKMLFDGSFGVYLVEKGEAKLITDFTKTELNEEMEAKPWERFKQYIKKYTKVRRTVDLIITPDVRDALKSMA